MIVASLIAVAVHDNRDFADTQFADTQYTYQAGRSPAAGWQNRRARLIPTQHSRQSTMAAAPRTAPGGSTHDLDRVTFGKRLRAARKAFGWTLQQVADSSGISVTTISRAERGQLALSYEKFSALASALKMDLAAMFSEAGARALPQRLQGPVVTRSGDGVAYRGHSIHYEFLATQAAGKQMSPILGTTLARRIEGPENFASHAGEEFVYVLRGSLEVHFATGEVVQLARGDSLYFDSRIPHAYISTSKQPAMTVGACTSESPMSLQAHGQAPVEARPAEATTAASRRRRPSRG